MPRFAHHFAAVAAAILIMAGSFGAVITVPSANAHSISVVELA